MNCRHCGKPIRSFNNYRGEEDWTHEDQMVGMWCQTTAAEPEVVHLIADGEAVTSCCGRTPFALPRTERLTVDPTLANCEAPTPTQEA